MKAADLIAGLAGLYALPFAAVLAAAAAIPLAYVLHAVGGFPLVVVATLAGAAKVWWAASRAEVPMIGDKFVGQLFTLWALSAGLWFAGVPSTVFPYPGWIGAFVMFNLFVRLPPIRRLGERGPLFDDFAAGALAIAVVAVSAFIAHGAA